MNYKRFLANFIHLNSVDSTNNYAANLLKATKVTNGTAILTKRQTLGRGQGDTVWQSNPDENLILSIITYPEINAEKAFYLNIVASLAIRKVLNDLGLDAEIKWPNDILINNKKIAGILIENQIRSDKIQSSIIGVGLNVNQTSFPPDIQATSTFNEKGIETDLEDIFHQFYGYLDFYMDHLMQSNFDLLKKLYYNFLFRLNEETKFEDSGGIFSGKIEGINESGRLVITSEGLRRVYDLKEVTYLDS